MSFLESDELQQRLFKSLFTYALLSFVAWALDPLFFTFVFPVFELNQWDLFVIEYLFMSILIQTISLMPVLLGWLRFVRYHFYLDPSRFCRADYDLLGFVLPKSTINHFLPFRNFNSLSDFQPLNTFKIPQKLSKIPSHFSSFHFKKNGKSTKTGINRVQTGTEIPL